MTEKAGEWRAKIISAGGAMLMQGTTTRLWLMSVSPHENIVLNHVAATMNAMAKVKEKAEAIREYARNHGCRMFEHTTSCSMMNAHQSYTCDSECVYLKWGALLSELEKIE